MKSIRHIIVTLSVVITFYEISAEFPSFIEKCKKSDSKCLLKSANKALVKLMPGLPELGVINTDKFDVDFLYINLGENIDLNLYSGQAITSFTSISSFKIEDDVLKFTLNIPISEWAIGFTVNGTISNNYFDYKGHTNLSYMNAGFNFKGKFESKVINGTKYLQIQPFKGDSKLFCEDFVFDYKLSYNLTEKEMEYFDKSLANIQPKFIDAIGDLGEKVITTIINIFLLLVPEKDVFLI